MKHGESILALRKNTQKKVNDCVIVQGKSFPFISTFLAHIFFFSPLFILNIYFPLTPFLSKLGLGPLVLPSLLGDAGAFLRYYGMKRRITATKFAFSRSACVYKNQSNSNLNRGRYGQRQL